MTAKVSKVTVKEGPFKLAELKSGEMQQWGKRWYLACPRCGMGLALDHEVTIVEGLQGREVTVSPSVGHPTCGLHIFIRNSIVQYLSDMGRKRDTVKTKCLQEAGKWINLK